ncbi:MAG: T9SS type A sorting domain-containing protein [Chitinophagales bacterium]|nr:T9SS type A sorting domain-containing protein [Chitinophagales bacterium]
MRKISTIALLLLFVSRVSGQQFPQQLNLSLSEKGFLENKGQVKDQHGRVNNEVKFLYNNGIFNLALKENSFSYELFQLVEDHSNMDEAGYNAKENDIKDFGSRIAGSVRIDVVLQGANKNVTIEATDPTGASFNFYSSPVAVNKLERINAYNTITYHNIYPGIDLVFRAPDQENGTLLHYDFIVHPGADPTKIKLQYQGDHNLALNQNGSLQLNTSIGYVQEGKPFTFQDADKKEVASAYVVAKNEVQYQLADYDKSKVLVIDPTLLWASYYGGPGDEDVAKVSVDKQHRPIIAGSTSSPFGISSTGAFQVTYGGDPSDLFVAKFKTNGKLDWASYFGGPDQDLGYGAIADKNNNIILYGKSRSDNMATVGQLVRGGSGDGIVVKFDPNGIFQWSTYKGAVNDDHYRNIRSDQHGNLYAVGYTESPNNMTTPGAFQQTYGGFGDCLFTKFSPGGLELWTTYFGNIGSDRFHAVNIDLFNHILVQGTTGSTSGMATTGAHQEIYGGGEEDVLVAQFDTNGHRIWSTYYGGEFSDRGRGIESDSAGNIYIGGLTESETGISTPGAHQETWTPGYLNNVRQEDGYVAKFSLSGEMIWGSYYGGDGYDRIWGISLDRVADALYIAGGTQSNDHVGTPSGWQPERISGTDGFFARWDFDGNLTWGSYWGGFSEDHLQDIEPDGEGFIYVLGVTNQSRMPVTPNVHQTKTGGGDEAMIYRFYPGLDCYDYNEPNNEFINAKQITGWAPIDSFFYGFNGSIVNKMDQDWYKLKVKSTAKNFMLLLTDKPAGYNLKLYNAQQVLLQSASNPANMNDTIIFNNAPAAYYYIRIAHGKNTFDSLNCYRLKVFQSSFIFETKSGENMVTTAETMSSVKVFPNPATDHLTFNITTAKPGNASILIYDMLGRLLFSNELLLDDGYQQIDIPINNLPEGSYRLLLKSSEKNWISTFIKTR